MDYSMANIQALCAVAPDSNFQQSISPVANYQYGSLSERLHTENSYNGYIKKESEEGTENHSSNSKSIGNLPENEPILNLPSYERNIGSKEPYPTQEPGSFAQIEALKVEGENPEELVSSHFLEPRCDIGEGSGANLDQLNHFNTTSENILNLNGSHNKYRKVTYFENNGRVFPGIELCSREPTRRGQIHPAAWKHSPTADRLIPFLYHQNQNANQFNFSNPSDFYLQKVQGIALSNDDSNATSNNSESDLGTESNLEDEKKHPLHDQSLDKEFLERHKCHTESGKGMYQCPECPYTTPYRANLKVHIMVHTGNKPYGCSSCDFKTTTSSNLKKHMREHTGERPYMCHECQSTFKTTGALKTHMLNHTGEKPFACPHCDYKSTKDVNLKRHIMTHTGEKKFACTECDYMCTGKKDLGRHMMVHTGEKPYSCPECDYACIQKETLKKHILTHTGERPFRCSQCTAGFRACGDLKRHMLVHTGEKPFACSACEYKCNKEVNLKRHMLTHTGEKPYSCPYCDYKCTENRLLKKHVMGHMNADGTYPVNRFGEIEEVHTLLPSSLLGTDDTSPADYMNSLGMLPVDS